MRICLTSLSLCVLCALNARAGTIDFTPTEGTRTLEGVVFKQLLFHQDGQTITYEPPRGWTCTGDSSGMRLTATQTSQAQAVLQEKALPAPQIFDEATMKELQQLSLAAVPGNASNVALVAEEKNPLKIHQQETYGVTVSYSLAGQDYEANDLFVNLNDLQLRLRTVARKADFEKVLREVRGSFFSLAWQ